MKLMATKGSIVSDDAPYLPQTSASNKPSNEEMPLQPRQTASEAAAAKVLTGAEIIWECLERLGVALRLRLSRRRHSAHL